MMFILGLFICTFGADIVCLYLFQYCGTSEKSGDKRVIKAQHIDTIGFIYLGFKRITTLLIR